MTKGGIADFIKNDFDTKLRTINNKAVSDKSKQLKSKNKVDSFLTKSINPKKIGAPVWPTCGFSKNAFSRERMKPCFFRTFNTIISCIFPGNFSEVFSFNIDYFR